MEIQHGTLISIIEHKALTLPHQMSIIILHTLELEYIQMAAMCYFSLMERFRALLTNPIGTNFTSIRSQSSLVKL
jgi:hypothetical protein